jgi:3-oxoacid CoA-transferase subunit A
MDKTYPNIREAVSDVFDGASIAFGGFFTCGNPIYLTEALAAQGAKELTVIAMSVGVGNDEINLLLKNRQVKKVICNYPYYRSFSRRSLFEEMLKRGEVQIELYPMGTFAEKLRAGGAGISAFYTPTGVGTEVAKGKETRVIDGKEVLLEYALRPDFAFIHACKADRSGNIVFRKTAMNYNPEMAKAARVTIAQVENLVEVGEIAPDNVHLPGIYVQRIVKVDRPQVDVTIEEPNTGTCG